MDKELKLEIKQLQEKTQALLNQFTIVCELIIGRLEDIDRCQQYLFSKITGNNKDNYKR